MSGLAVVSEYFIQNFTSKIRLTNNYAAFYIKNIRRPSSCLALSCFRDNLSRHLKHFISDKGYKLKDNKLLRDLSVLPLSPIIKPALSVGICTILTAILSIIIVNGSRNRLIKISDRTLI